jgi:hypothetical protein
MAVRQILPGIKFHVYRAQEARKWQPKVPGDGRVPDSPFADRARSSNSRFPKTSQHPKFPGGAAISDRNRDTRTPKMKAVLHFLGPHPITHFAQGFIRRRQLCHLTQNSLLKSALIAAALRWSISFPLVVGPVSYLSIPRSESLEIR